MTKPPKQGPVFTIAQDWDFTILSTSAEDETGERTITKFLVKKEALTSFSEYFAASLRFNSRYRSQEGSMSHSVEDDDAGALRIWLTYIHFAMKHNFDKSDEEIKEMKNPFANAGADTMDRLFRQDGVYDADIERVWHIIDTCDKYLFKGELLRDFFNRWYAKNVKYDQIDEDFARQLPTPCFMFDHAQGFAGVTKWLAYHSVGHITENRPPGFKWEHIHLAPPEFVGPMNSARGRLKTVLHTGIWDPAGSLLKQGKRSSTCTHWAESAGLYFSALVDARVYPLEMVWPKHSVSDVLSSLGGFRGQDTGKCSVCKVDWAFHVRRAQDMTSKYFHGLCIDCMDASRLSKGKNPDAEYWVRNRKGPTYEERWDHGCRIKHGQPTWYASWTGRDEHRQKLMEKT